MLNSIRKQKSVDRKTYLQTFLVILIFLYNFATTLLYYPTTKTPKFRGFFLC